MALLTVIYDKPLQVSIKHCLGSVMLELASDTRDFATIRYSAGQVRDNWTNELKEFHPAITQIIAYNAW